MAFGLASENPLQQAFAGWPPEAARGTHHQQISLACPAWSNQQNTVLQNARNPCSCHDHHQHRRLHRNPAPTGGQHMLPPLNAAPAFGCQQHYHAGWMGHPETLSGNAQGALGQVRQQRIGHSAGTDAPHRASHGIWASGLNQQQLQQQQHPSGEHPDRTGYGQQQGGNFAELHAAQLAPPTTKASAKRLRLSPVQEHAAAFTAPAPAFGNAWPARVQQAEGSPNTAENGFDVMQSAHHALQPGSNPSFCAFGPGANPLQSSWQQQQPQTAYRQSLRSIQAQPHRHSTATESGLVARAGAGLVPGRGVRPGLLAEIAADLGVTAPAALPKCRAFVPHHPKQQTIPARKQTAEKSGRNRTVHASGMQQAQLANLSDSASSGMRGVSTAQHESKISSGHPPSQERSISATDNQLGTGIQPRQGRIPDAPLDVAPGMFVTAGSRRPVVPATARSGYHSPFLQHCARSPKVPGAPDGRQLPLGERPGHTVLPAGPSKPEDKQLSTALANSSQAPAIAPGQARMASEGAFHQERQKHDTLDCAPDTAAGQFMMAGTRQPRQREQFVSDAPDQAPDVAPGQFVTAAAASSGRPDAAPGQIMAAGRAQPLRQRGSVQCISHLHKKNHRQPQQPGLRSAASRRDFLSSFAAELADLSNTNAEEGAAGGHLGPFQPAEPLAAASPANPPLAGVEPDDVHPSVAFRQSHAPPDASHNLQADAQHEHSGTCEGEGHNGMERLQDGRPSGASANAHPQPNQIGSGRRMSLDQGVLAGLMDTQLSSQRWSASSRPVSQPEHASASAQPAATEHQTLANGLQPFWPKQAHPSILPAMSEQFQPAADLQEPSQASAFTGHAGAGAPQLRTAQGNTVLLDPVKLLQARRLLDDGDQGAGQPRIQPSQLSQGAPGNDEGLPELEMRGTPNMPDEMQDASIAQDPAHMEPSSAVAMLQTAKGQPIIADSSKLQQAQKLLGHADSPAKAASISMQTADRTQAQHAAASDAPGAGFWPTGDPNIGSLQLTTAAGKPINLDSVKLQRAQALLADTALPHGDPGQNELQSSRLPTLPAASAASTQGPGLDTPLHDGLSLLQTAAGKPTTLGPVKLQQAQALLGDDPPLEQTVCVQMKEGPFPVAAPASRPACPLPAPATALQSGLSLLQTAAGQPVTLDPAKLKRAQALLADVAAPSGDASDVPHCLPAPRSLPDAALKLSRPELRSPAAMRGGLLQTAGGTSITIDAAKLQQAQALLGKEPAHELATPDVLLDQKQATAGVVQSLVDKQAACTPGSNRTSLRDISNGFQSSSSSFKPVRKTTAAPDQPAHHPQQPGISCSVDPVTAEPSSAERRGKIHAHRQLQAPGGDEPGGQAAASDKPDVSAPIGMAPAAGHPDLAHERLLEQCQTPQRNAVATTGVQTPASGMLSGLESPLQAGMKPGPRQRRSNRSRLAASVSASAGTHVPKAAEGPSGVMASSFKVPRRSKFKTPMRKLAMTKVRMLRSWLTLQVS